MITQNEETTADELRVELSRLGEVMQNHPVFSEIKDVRDLRLFMQWHVFAVWDFMSLLKRLQQDLTCVSVPWSPPIHAASARLINEIVLGEESDVKPDGTTCSHFELYCESMREVSAETTQIIDFVNHIRAGDSPGDALLKVDAPRGVIEFVCSTLSTAIGGATHEVLGAFLFGREDVIPGMFRTLLTTWRVSEDDAPSFVYYLARHIEIDGDSHGPHAHKLARILIGDDQAMHMSYLLASINAVRARIRLWDALENELHTRRSTELTNISTS